jgi:hypothetical protein
MPTREPVTLLSVEKDGITYDLKVAHVLPDDLAQANALQLPVAVVARKAEAEQQQ